MKSSNRNRNRNNNGKPDNKKSGNRNRGNEERRPKEAEVDVPRGSINKADVQSMFKAQSDPSNDPSWYAKNEQLLKDAASFPMSYSVGQKISFAKSVQYTNAQSVTSTIDASSDSWNNAIPGILRMTYVPVLGGNATQPNSPINVASNALFTYVRKANSGQANYDAPDLTMYCMAMGSAFSYYATLARIYGLLRQYQFYNRYMPEAILRSMGLDASILQANMADLRYGINVFAYKLGSMCVPSDFSQVTRQTWLQSQVFSDSANAKSQLYYWDSLIYYIWTEGQVASNPDQPNYLQAVTPGWVSGDMSQPPRVSDLLDFGNQMIDPIIGSESMKIMSGDILKAFGANNLYTISPINEDYTVSPAYSEEVLMQIENAFFMGSDYYSKFNWNITQNLDNLWSGPFIVQNLFCTDPAGHGGNIAYHWINFPFNERHFLNFHKEVVSPADMMVATRMHPHYLMEQDVMIGSSGLSRLTIVSSGTEVPISMSIWTFNTTNATSALTVQSMYGLGSYVPYVFTDTPAMTYDEPVLSTTIERWKASLALINFDWAPILYPIFLTFESEPNAAKWLLTNVQTITPQMDVDNYTMIDGDDLDPMHETAVLSEYTIGEMNFNS